MQANVERLGVSGFTSTFAINLTGNDLANEMWGNDGVNVMSGAGGDDILTAFGSSDTLKGGLGADTLIGGSGNDDFVFDTALGGGNIDQLLDFQAGADRLVLDDGVFAGLAPGALAPGAFRIGAAAQDADDRILYDSSTGALYYDADGSGAGAAVQFATLLNAPANLSASDFLVF